MGSLAGQLTSIVSAAFESAGYDASYGVVRVSDRPDLCQFQCNGALPAAKQYKTNPREIAQKAVDALGHPDVFKEISLAGPGFINITLTGRYLAEHLAYIYGDDHLGCNQTASPRSIIVDYGGPNVAKPLHVGHLRAAIIGESVVRICRYMGHDVIGDVHLGDWGLQMGLNIVELQNRKPDLPYFDPDFTGSYPDFSPVSIADLEDMYPQASKKGKQDPDFGEAARQATVELQDGRPGYLALWKHFRQVSIDALKENYAALNVHFDLWLGESDTQDRISGLVERLKQEGYAYESQGALVVDVATPEDTHPIPPLMLVKSDGAVLYGTTDLATLDQREADYHPDLVLYVVDNRQRDHFHQVFTAAHKTGVTPKSTTLEHNGFGTMNGKDGKPFKTRAGGIMKLKDLIDMVTDSAMSRIEEIESIREYNEEEKENIARIVGVAALKYADLMNHRIKDYVFDLDRFSSFEGRTGPYLLYTAVRIKSILRRAKDQGFRPGAIVSADSDIERDVGLKLSEFPAVLDIAFESRAPNHLCEYAFQLATVYNRFYHGHHILTEKDETIRASWLALSSVTLRMLDQVLDLLGIDIPDRM